MRTLVLASLLAACCLPAAAQNFAAPNDSAPASIPKKPLSFDVNAIDKTADPCTDFYQYACGNWRKANPIPGDQVRWGRFNELAEYNNYSLYSELKLAADSPKTPLQHKYGDFFAACMNTTHINELGYTPLKPELARIAALKSAKEIWAFNVESEKEQGGGRFFNIGIEQDQKDSTKQILTTGQRGALGLPDRDYYLNDDDRSKTIRTQYVDHMTKMFVLIGDSPEEAAKEAAAVMAIETILAKGSMARVEMRDPANTYHMMTVAELQAKTPGYDWRKVIDSVGLTQAKDLNVSSPGYVSAVESVFTTQDPGAIKSYMRWHAVHSKAAMLSQAFVDENFNFFAKTLTGAKEQLPRWKICTSGTDRALGEAVGQDWVAANFPPSAKDNMEKLIKALEAAMAVDLQHLDWMSDATKVEARKKLDAIADKIGYPAKWRDYSTLAVKRDDFFGNAMRTAVFNDKREMRKFGKPVDKTEWGMTPPTVNAYYDPAMNNINFPAGILEPPFYDNSLDAAPNFGGIGVVIGHEMTHGFDDEGAKYDLNGNVRQWWTDEDKKKFETRTGCLADEYSGFTVTEGAKLNGKLTLGENTADNGGLRIAFMALKDTIAKDPAKALPGYVDGKRDGYTAEQRFFLGFGQVWCENRTDAYSRMSVKVDPHSAGQWRTNGSVQNFEEFGKAFGCKVGAPMMPANGGCRIW